jgi:hypothetical protein
MISSAPITTESPLRLSKARAGVATLKLSRASKEKIDTIFSVLLIGFSFLNNEDFSLIYVKTGFKSHVGLAHARIPPDISLLA